MPTIRSNNGDQFASASNWQMGKIVLLPLSVSCINNRRASHVYTYLALHFTSFALREINWRSIKVTYFKATNAWLWLSTDGNRNQ